MKGLLKNDVLITVIGLSVVVFGYLGFVFFPGLQRNSELEDEIAAAERRISEQPMRAVELNRLDDQIEERVAFLREHEELIPQNGDVHAIIGQVAQLAERSGLTVTRFEPLTAKPHSAYRSLPFTLSFSGRYSAMMSFLSGIERRPRIFAINEFTLRVEDERSTGVVEGDIKFAVYVRHEDFSVSVKKNDESFQRIADSNSTRVR